jgi:hypothetical protein
LDTEKITKKEKRKTWQYPWGYKESFLVVAELMLLGLIIEVLSRGRGFTGVEWPLNIIIGLAIILLIAILHFFFRSKPIIKWLSSVPAAVSAISFFAFLVLLLGFIPQGNPHNSQFVQILGLYHIKNSWIFVVSGLYLLISLGLVTFRRSNSLSKKNIGFILNHAGLWITLAAGSLGSGDLMRVTSQLNENGEPVTTAVSRINEVRELPFSMKLIDFNIEQYAPKLGIVDFSTGELIEEEGIKTYEAIDGNQINYGSWSVHVDTLYSDAFLDSSVYIPLKFEGAAPAAFVTVKNNLTSNTVSGWVSCGSVMVPYQHVLLDKRYVMVMMKPEAEKFSSEIIFGYDQNSDTATVEVNKPYKIKGYNIYQLSYDEQMGKYSRVSVVEVVKDPWLPIVYFGIFLLLGGSAYLFWIGNEPKNVEK